MSPLFISEMFKGSFACNRIEDCADFPMVYERDQVLMRSLCCSKLRHNDNGVETNYTPLSPSLSLSLPPVASLLLTLPSQPEHVELLTSNQGTRNLLNKWKKQKQDL